MSSITNANNSSYYQLFNSSSNNGGTSSAVSPSDALLQDLEGINGNTSSSDPAYSLNLSAAAQSYLSNPTSTSTANPLTGSTSFTLSTTQQSQISAILAKYKDAPYTQATFNSIQNDLNAAGLGTNTLVAKDQAQNFNPTQLFIDDLNGNYSNDATASVSSSSEQAKTSNYMQSIISQWQSISTTYSPSSTVTGSTSGA